MGGRQADHKSLLQAFLANPGQNALVFAPVFLERYPKYGSRMSVHFLERKLNRFRRQCTGSAPSKSRDQALTDLLALIDASSIQWDVIVPIQELGIRARDSAQLDQLPVKGLKLFLMNNETWSEYWNQITPDSALEQLKTALLGKVCCKTSIFANPRDDEKAAEKGIKKVDALMSFVRIGLQAASKLLLDPIPIGPCIDLALVRPETGKNWLLYKSKQPNPLSISKDVLSTIRTIHDPFLEDLVTSCISHKEVSHFEDAVVSTFLLMNAAEKERTLAVKFLSYMTALERLLAPRQRGTESISFLLAVRGSLLYSGATVPGNLVKFAAIAPDAITRLYDKRSRLAHGSILRCRVVSNPSNGKRGRKTKSMPITPSDLQRIRSLCHSSFQQVVALAKETDLATYGDLLDVFDSALSILAVHGCSASIRSVSRFYARLYKKPESLTSAVMQLLIRNEFLIPEDRVFYQLAEKGHKLLDFLAQNHHRLPPFPERT